MFNILVDPVAVQLPSAEASREEVEQWLTMLTLWLQEALTTPLSWFHCWQASQLLEEYGQFPNFPQLKQLQQKHRLDINVSQISRKVNEFFRDNVLDVEEYLKQLDYAIEPQANSVAVEPEQFIVRLPEYLHANLHLLLANCCACKQIAHPFGQKLYIATQALKDGSKEITISVVVLDALPDFARPPDNKITQTIPLLITPDDLQPLNEIVVVWSKGEKSIVYAIRQQLRKESVVTTSKPFAFHLGPSFIQSVNERGLDTNETVLRTIIRAAANVILDRAKDIKGYALHNLRASETPDSPRRERAIDNAQAWRLKLQQRWRWMAFALLANSYS
jgi:hypothetical protein